MRILLFTLGLLCFSKVASAQKIYGTVYDNQGDLLPYSSITIKGTTIGTSANEKANFSFYLKEGIYTLICQHIGYTSQEKIIKVKDQTEVTFILTPQKLELENVVVKNGGEDPAYQIIRNAIAKREEHANEVNAFTCELYTKDLVKLRRLPKRILGQKIPDEDRKGMGVDSNGQGIIYLSEALSQVNIQQPDKFKLQVKNSRVSGTESFGFTFPSFISFYANNVNVFSSNLNPRGFVSPIADGAIGFYKFKFLGSFFENDQAINVIQVTPRRDYEPLFSGTINITDGDWRIYSTDLLLTKKSQLEIIDSLQITQLYVPVKKETWRVKNQLIQFNFKQFGIDAIGNFLSVYSDYNIHPVFEKGFFDRTIIKYDTGVANKPKTFWDSVRPVPLEKEEALDYKVKDSIYAANKDSLLSKTSLDSLNKKEGKIDPFKFLFGGINNSYYTKSTIYKYGFSSFLSTLEYNFAEGVVLEAKPYLEIRPRKKGTAIRIEPTVRYGFSNEHTNAWLTVRGQKRQADNDEYNLLSWQISGGKRVSNFNKNTTLTPLINSITSILFGNNFLKTYENYYGSFSVAKRYESGLMVRLTGLYEDRMPLYNTTDYLFYKKYKDNITPNYPFEKLNAQFTPHQAVELKIEATIKPGQRYIQFPTYKMAIGSKYPTFTATYTKGIEGIFGSDVNYDKWKLNASDDINFKLGGLLKYNLSLGGFLNAKKVFIQDYTHYDANYSRSDYNSVREYLQGFQLPRYFQYSNIDQFYGTAFIEHHLNGLLTNKIPLFKKLKWNAVVGSNFLYLKNTNYVEVFAGLENIFKIFRLDVVSGYENGIHIRTGLRLGAGGILGSAVRRSSIGNSDNNKSDEAVRF